MMSNQVLNHVWNFEQTLFATFQVIIEKKAGYGLGKWSLTPARFARSLATIAMIFRARSVRFCEARGVSYNLPTRSARRIIYQGYFSHTILWNLLRCPLTRWLRVETVFSYVHIIFAAKFPCSSINCEWCFWIYSLLMIGSTKLIRSPCHLSHTVL